MTTRTLQNCRHRRRAIGILALGALALAALSGCAKPIQGWSTSSNAGESGVFRTEAIAAYDRSPRAPLEFDRYEYARKDASLNPVAWGPVVASRQWPQAPKPAERRIIFWYWEQR